MTAIENTPYKHTVAIIGAGYSGYRFFHESILLTLKDELADKVRYVFVDPRDFSEYGRGVAWSSDQSDLLRANMHATSIVIDRRDSDRLAREMRIEEADLIADGKLFEKRNAVGDIISSSFQDAWAEAIDGGIECHHIQDRAVSVHRQGVGQVVRLSEEGEFFANTIILALGHFPPTNHTHLFDIDSFVRSPWDWQKLSEKISPDSSVGVIGLGPTAVDTVFVLRSIGVQDIHGHSRSGTMQYPRSRPAQSSCKIMHPKGIKDSADLLGGLTVDMVLGMATAEFVVSGVDWAPMREAVRNARLPPLRSLPLGLAQAAKTRADESDSAWYGLMLEIDDMLPDVWNALAEEERPKLINVRRQFSPVCYGMAPPQAAKLLHELEAQTFRTHDGLKSVEYDTERRKFCFTSVRQGHEFVDEYDFAIDCSGFGSDIAHSGWPLIESMVKEGLIVRHDFGGCYNDFATGQICDKHGEPTADIYCLTGSLTLGTRLVTNGLGECAKSAVRTASHLHMKLLYSVY